MTKSPPFAKLRAIERQLCYKSGTIVFDFCKNVALGPGTPLSKLFDDASKGRPDPNWDFEPDVVHMKEGVILRVSDEGGEPHTFTEVKQFGGGFLTGLNGPGEETVPDQARYNVIAPVQHQLPALS